MTTRYGCCGGLCLLGCSHLRRLRQLCPTAGLRAASNVRRRLKNVSTNCARIFQHPWVCSAGIRPQRAPVVHASAWNRPSVHGGLQAVRCMCEWEVC